MTKIKTKMATMKFLNLNDLATFLLFVEWREESLIQQEVRTPIYQDSEYFQAKKARMNALKAAIEDEINYTEEKQQIVTIHPHTKSRGTGRKFDL